MKIQIKGGHLIDPASGLDVVKDLFIAAGRVVGVGEAPAGFSANRSIDASGLTVLPGLVDLSVRLKDSGWGDASGNSELRAAAAGGVTRVVCPPDTDPILDEPGLVDRLTYRMRQGHGVQVHPLGALTLGLKGETIAEMAQLREAGCVGISQADEPVADATVLQRALQYALTHGLTVWLRPLEANLSRGGVAASGALASRLGLSGVPVAAESIALLTLFELLRGTPCRVHITRLSTARGVELVRQAKREGLPVSCDVSVHNLHLTEADIGFFNPMYRLDPPLRTQRDRDALLAGLADGTIDAVCSDHRPVADDDKTLPFGEAVPGASGVEHLLPLMLKWAHAHQRPLADVVRLIAGNPARIAGVNGGSLRVGEQADLCVLDTRAMQLVSRETMVSASRATPWLGYELPGAVRATLVAGQVVWERTASGEPAASPLA
ncbi:dihydroorotase [Piscinibacterium candidicorallinum]|uniref:Dihydroorotase n=1 Tax=Piscinibacterium candidicorallinum TaxID=1793872 RepID=A0ABV7H4Q5_9BURK